MDSIELDVHEVLYEGKGGFVKGFLCSSKLSVASKVAQIYPTEVFNFKEVS